MFCAQFNHSTVLSIMTPAADSWTKIQNKQGELLEHQPGWTPLRLFGLGEDARLLISRHETGESAGWLLDKDNRFVDDLAYVEHAPEAAASLLAGSAISGALKILLETPEAEDRNLQQLHDLYLLDEKLYASLLGLIDVLSDAKFVRLTKNNPNPTFLRDGNVFQISRESALANPMWAGSDFERSISLHKTEMPAVVHGAVVEVSRNIPLSMSIERAIPFYFTRESGITMLRFAHDFWSTEGLTFIPCQNVIFHDFEAEADARALARAAVQKYLELIGSLDAGTRSKMTARPTSASLLLSGRQGGRHFGHAILDELQALDRAVACAARQTPFNVYYTKENGGSDLFGPIEELYPELDGFISCVENTRDLLTDALMKNTAVSYENGRKALHATRTRITTVVRTDGRRHGLYTAADTIVGRGAQRRPVIGLSLRLMNRRPVDLLGFYVALTRQLAERFGGLVVVIDGINGIDGQVGSAATIYSAGATAGQHLSQGESEMDAEYAFVEAFSRRIEDIDARIVNCVGSQIRPNLFWLDQCDYFVAPLGAGIAKFRWALDKPGFVLTGAINLEWCNAYDIYSSDQYTDHFGTEIQYNNASDVEDLCSEMERQAIVRKMFVPFPYNFNFVDQDAVIQKIEDHIAVILERGPAITLS